VSADDNLPVPHEDDDEPTGSLSPTPSEMPSELPPPPVGQDAWQPPPWNDVVDAAAVAGPSLAGYGWRVLGFLIDGLILATATALFAKATTAWVALAFSIAARILYPAILIATWEGATVGMKVVGIRCVDEKTEQPVTMAQSFVRSVGAELIAAVGIVVAIGGILELLDLAWPIWDKRNQTLHDKIGRTIVTRPPKAVGT
jgi:uncharacterized RDD family membrane protein YckC